MNPRQRHLEVLYLIFHFVWQNPKKRNVLDHSTPLIDESVFHSKADWVDHHKCQIHWANLFLCLLLMSLTTHTGILLFICNGLIEAFSKRQNAVAELVALHIARDKIMAMRNKLKPVGVPLVGGLFSVLKLAYILDVTNHGKRGKIIIFWPPKYQRESTDEWQQTLNEQQVERCSIQAPP